MSPDLSNLPTDGSANWLRWHGPSRLTLLGKVALSISTLALVLSLGGCSTAGDSDTKAAGRIELAADSEADVQALLDGLFDPGFRLEAVEGPSLELTGEELQPLVSIEADAGGQRYRAVFDVAGLESLLLERATSEFSAQETNTRYLLVDSAGQQITVLREGAGVQTLTDIPGTVEAIVRALQSRKTAAPVSWSYAPPQEVRLPVSAVHDGHWVDVHLDSQTATMFDGATPVKTFLISGGLPDTPTPQGSFEIAVKELDTSIVGPEYAYYGIVWVGWNNTYALHSAYWHDSFGQPMSHGCINMRRDDVLEVYDWLDYGDWVEVHP